MNSYLQFVCLQVLFFCVRFLLPQVGKELCGHNKQSHTCTTNLVDVYLYVDIKRTENMSNLGCNKRLHTQLLLTPRCCTKVILLHIFFTIHYYCKKVFCPQLELKNFCLTLFILALVSIWLQMTYDVLVNEFPFSWTYSFLDKERESYSVEPTSRHQQFLLISFADFPTTRSKDL